MALFKISSSVTFPVFFALVIVLTFNKSTAKINRYPYDVACNNDSDYRCVCYWGPDDHSLRGIYPDCKKFVSSNTLRTVSVGIKNLDITGAMWNGERYEFYFKRRLANLVTTYCEENANRCPETVLRVEQDRVVILEVKCADKNETTVNFVVTKSDQAQQLYQQDTMSPLDIVKLLSEAKPKLEALLGGIRITAIHTTLLQLRPDKSTPSTPTVPDKPGKMKNKGIIIFLIIVAIFFAIVYIIAIFKVVRATKRKRKEEKKKHRLNAETPPDYGTTNHNELPNPPVPRPTDLAEHRRSSSSDRQIVIVNRVDEDEEDVEEQTETAPLMSNVRPSSPPAKHVARYPQVALNHFDFLSGPQTHITKSLSMRSIEKIEELPEPEDVGQVSRSATFHEFLNQEMERSEPARQQADVDVDSSESDSEEEDTLQPGGYTVLQAESMETLVQPQPMQQPVDIRIEFTEPDTPPKYYNGFDSEEEIEENQNDTSPAAEKTITQSVECLVKMENTSSEPDLSREWNDEVKKKDDSDNSSLSQTSSSEGEEDSGLGLNSNQYQRLAESISSITPQVEEQQTYVYQPIP